MISHLKKIINYNELTIFIVLIVSTFILRILVAMLTFSEYQIDSWADSREFLWFGYQFSLGNFNPHWEVEDHGLVVGPFVPLLIAIFVNIFDSPLWPFFTYNCLSTSILVYILYLIGKNIFNKRVGLLIAIWAIFYPDFYRYNIQILKEPTVYLFLPMTILFTLLSIKNKGKIVYVILSSLSFSILMHADPRYFFFLPIFLISYIITNESFFSRLKSASYWIMSCLIFSMPMLIRNYNIYGEIIFVTPQTISITHKLWKSNLEPYNRSLSKQLLVTDSSTFKSDSIKSAEEKYYDNRLKNALIQSAGEGRKPYKYGEYEKYFMAFIHYWQPTFFTTNFLYDGFRYQKWSIKHNISSLLFYGIFLPFYFIGIPFLIREKNLFGIFIAGIPLFHCLMHVYVILALERYRSHINFCIILIAFWTIIQLISYYRLNNKTISQ